VVTDDSESILCFISKAAEDDSGESDFKFVEIGGNIVIDRDYGIGVVIEERFIDELLRHRVQGLRGGREMMARISFSGTRISSRSSMRNGMLTAAVY
jgi:hypothetical protein